MFKSSSLFIIVLIVFCAGCVLKNDSQENSTAKTIWGDSLLLNETDYYQTLFPHAVVDAVSSHIASQVYEGLLMFNTKDLYVQPSIAERWMIDSAGTTYTFFLKKGVKFHDDVCFENGIGREVTANDFNYCFKQLCTYSENNKLFETTFKDILVGANEYYAKSKTEKPSTEIEGIKVLDDYTLQLKVTQSSGTFLLKLATLATAVFPKEGYDTYGNELKIGTGPFVFPKSGKDFKRLVLSRNVNYHVLDSSGKKLPYLDKICFTFLPNKKDELEAFKKGEIDAIIGLPSEDVNTIVQKQIKKFQGDSAIYTLERIPEMITHFFEFNVTRPPFDNVKVRQAFNYAINRDRIVEVVLNNEAYGPAESGVVPPSFRDYDISKIKGYTYDPEKARKLLAEAGYPGGKGFPSFKFLVNSGGQRNTSVAFEVEKQLINVLGITINIDVVSFPDKINAVQNGTADMYKNALGADYPSPESFLWSFYGKTLPADKSKPSYPNTSRYFNQEYDLLFEAGKKEINEQKCFEYFAKAEQLMMTEAPVIVLWYDESYQLKQSKVKNLFPNPLRYRNYTQVYKETPINYPIID
ncbi:MAG: ABC transporter substrate-binding protein [Bacteroidetes bacterium]|nr:ABC transporter substrate-binding protein [Bacteroidota bacterium]